MKNILNAFLVFSAIFFIGCSSTALSATEGKTYLEGKEVSAYLVGEYMDVKSASKKLEEAGFVVIANYESIKKGNTIVFTNNALKKEATKPGRAYVAVMRLFIDEKEKMISFTNPVYFGKAFMQNEYKHNIFQSVKESLTKAFPNLKDSKDKLAFEKLASYQYMKMMPYYQDQDELGSGSYSELVEKATKFRHGKLLVFELKLSESSTLLGYELGRRTKKFVKKIGRENAAVLPYCIAIENDKAKALAAKYYLALSYPLLSMGKFMTIATIPGAIEKELAKPFKSK